MANLFDSIFHSIRKNKKAYLIGLLLLLSGLIWVASKIQFDEDISKLIPSNEDNAQLQKVLNTAQFSDKIIINIKKEKDADLVDLTDYAQQLLDSLNEHSNNYIKNIQGKVEDETIFETLDFAFENAPLFLTDSDYQTLVRKTQKDSIDATIEANYKLLASPSGIVAKQTIIKDPLGVSILAVQNLKQLGFNEDFELKDGFLVSKDGNHILLFITPKFKSSETNQNELFAEQLYQFQEHLNQEYKGKISSEAFGGSLIAVANAQQIKKDIQWTVTIAMIALLVLFITFYKKLTIPLILLVPTIFGGLLSVAILYLIRTEISAISLGIGAVLLGVTLDYSLHILTHIRNNETIERLYADVAKPILMSSLTTALAFLCLLFIDSQALQDLGIFAAISVLGASLFALVFIPQVYKGKAAKALGKRSFIDSSSNYAFHKNKWLIGGLVLLLIVSAFTYNKVGFNNDLSNLNYESQQLKDAEQHLDELTNETSKSLYVIANGNEIQNVLETNDELFEQLKELETSKDIISFNSIAALVPSQKSQKEKINRWQNFWTSEKIQQTESDLRASGQTQGFKQNSFEEFHRLLNKEFQPLDLEEFKKVSNIPLEDFVASSGDFHTITSILKVDDDNIQAVKKTFQNQDNVIVIDRQNLNETLLGHLKTDFNHLIIYCFMVVLVLLLLFYRNIKLTLVTVIPIIITWFITIGVIGLLGIEFNIFSILISSFIFGLGVDYSIFMTNGLLKQQQEANENTLATHKTSVLLSVLTTILGIGVLIFAKHPALHSISVVSMIGIIIAMLIAFTIQPLLFKLLIFDRKRHQ
ncbi:MMPL family transporter [Subsaxibacter sp. CAU 1640]|uniref:MMPL family transporter n=1 Tax=Subsaxibacter sp. CAU 1640 TaxID=2933271 RepID=UPI0020034586|nr:MMPL family transporter [Subsaxibacter sp. CAU 1640]MCK7589460.1 MMPL family transporter [Subsaxibacter sp. CAU 1640]